MRICLIAPIPPFRGGIAKYCYSLAQELEKRHELLLLSYHRQYPRFLYGRKSQVDPSINRAEMQREFRNLSYDIDSLNPWSWHNTVQRIEEFSPDAVIFPWWVTYWAPMYLYLHHSLERKGIRAIFLCINVFEHEDSPVKKILSKIVLGRAASMIVHSELEKNEIFTFNARANVEIHPLPLFEYGTKVSSKRGDSLNVLFFGFIRPYKGLDILLKAVAMLKGRGLRLRVVGEFWDDKGKYLELIDSLGIVEMVEITDGYVSEEEMCACFAWADLVVLPYLRSRTSGIIATAYGFGKPVLATDVGGFREVVMEGLTGKLVEPDSPRALADGIEWFMGSREVDFAVNIAEFASRKMSWESLVDVIENLSIIRCRQF